MPWYRTGTVSVTNGATTVTGSGTNWIDGAAVGEAFIGPDAKVYEIAAVISATQITLATAYQGTTQTGQSYQIVPSQSYIRDLAAQAATLVANYGTAMTSAGHGAFGDGTVSAPGVRFTADGDTGLRRVGTNSVAVVAGGADRLTVDTAGASVTGNLSVSGTLTTNNFTLTGNTTLGDAAGDTLTINGTAVSIPNNLNIDSNTLFIDAVNNRIGIGTATPTNALTVAGNFNVTGNTTIGDAPTDTLTVHPNAVTWSNNPTHSGNHTFSGNVTVQGNTTLGDAAGDTITVTGTPTFSTATLHAAGTAAAPAITRSGDTDTGIFFPAADTIAFAEGGAEAMRIDSNSNLLIGTTTNTNNTRLTVNGEITETVNSVQVKLASRPDIGTRPGQVPLNQYLGSMAYAEIDALPMLRGLGLQVFAAGGSIGYAAGAGGAVTQATSKSTGVTLNTPAGQVTMNNAALAAGAVVSFTLTNSAIAATDVVVLNIASGATAGAYRIAVDQVSDGSCRISVQNTSGGSLSEAIVLNFAVIKAVAA